MSALLGSVNSGAIPAVYKIKKDSNLSGVLFNMRLCPFQGFLILFLFRQIGIV